MTTLTRRRFVSLLGALPFVGPALLAVASKAAASEIEQAAVGFGLDISPSIADPRDAYSFAKVQWSQRDLFDAAYTTHERYEGPGYARTGKAWCAMTEMVFERPASRELPGPNLETARRHSVWRGLGYKA